MSRKQRYAEQNATSQERQEQHAQARKRYFAAVKTAKTKHWNSFLEKAKGKDIFTALRYTKEKTLRKIPPLQYTDNGQEKTVESFQDQCHAFLSTLFSPPPTTSPPNTSHFEFPTSFLPPSLPLSQAWRDGNDAIAQFMLERITGKKKGERKISDRSLFPFSIRTHGLASSELLLPFFFALQKATRGG